MTEQKKSAQTAATVRSAKETHQKQNTTDSGEKQAITGPEFPMDADRTIACLESQTGEMPPILKKLWSEGIAPLANNSYERGKKGLTPKIGDLVAENGKLNDGKADQGLDRLFRKVMELEKRAYEAGHKEYCECLSLPYKEGESHD